MENNIDDIQLIYQQIKPQIEERLREFENLWENSSEYDIYKELIFCLFTPQSKAERCWQAVQKLEENDLLYCGDCQKIAACIRTYTRFHHTKARNMIFVLNTFFKNNRTFRQILISFQNNREMREWLVENIKGMGYKEASHFLRNIGKGNGLAILDRHILRKLVEYNIIKNIPKSLTKKQYLDIESHFKKFADRLNIPIIHLDFVLWFQTTGWIFK